MSGPGSAGMGLKILGGALIVIGALLYGITESLVGPLLMVAGGFAHFRGRQRLARARAESAASPLADDKADVLYLRSFSSDTATFGRIAMSAWSTEEEQLAAALRPIGDLIAIGRPGESLPLPGAA